jgi:hypothetical protein
LIPTRSQATAAQLVMARGIVNLSLSLAIWANDEPRTTLPQPPIPARKVRLMGRFIPTKLAVALDEAARSQNWFEELKRLVPTN